MGAEAKCTATISGKKTVGKALLETDELIFRGEDVRLTIPYRSVSSIDVKDGVLHVAWLSGVASFELGPSAVKWADRIRNPPSRIDKLDVKPGQVVLFVCIRDATLREEIETRGAIVVARVIDPVDTIFVAANERSDLRRLATLQNFLKRDGAIWVIRPKGSPNISENDVMSAGKGVGLVDVKVVRFSETHTAEKFVIPVSKR
jgi:hypothetical protein